MKRRAILVDVTKCVGCGECVDACQKANGHVRHAARKFDEQTFTYLLERDQDLFVRRLCMHCENPSCVSVCPVTALRKTPEGPVTYDPSKCMGCRYCMMACPFGVPTYEWASVAPRVRKCQMCVTRAKGPACAEACPAQASVTGEREALIVEARQRLADQPKTYFPYLYGLTQAGGTDVLYLGPKEPKALGLPSTVAERPLADLTWQALRHVPDVVLFGSVILGGLFWITSRRDAVRRAEGADDAERDGE
jgi:formate dehydrogenase iron-sulfur subunit